jgi:hypothetical protein
LFRRGNYRNKGHSPGKLSWVLVLVEIFSVARKISTIEERRQDIIICFGEEVTGTKVTDPKTVVGSSLGEDVGFRDGNFFL